MLLWGAGVPTLRTRHKSWNSCNNHGIYIVEIFDVSIQKAIEDALNKAFKERGHLNILIAGRSGVGKSTLINEIFQGNFTDTGQGRPVTQTIKEITKKDIPLTIWDTKGLEIAEYKKTFNELEQLILLRNKSETDPMRRIHTAWICIHEDGRRVEQAEIELHNMLAGHMPVIGVITKARSDNGFKSEVERLLPEARNIARVRALTEELDEGHRLQPMGLKELVELTLELIPESAQRAFVASQKVSMELKKEQANKVVYAAAAAASAAGVVPIPIADAAVIVPIQIGMLAKISSVFGLSPSEALLKTLVAALIGTTAATMTGRAIVSGLLKLIPGAGSIVGGAIAAAAAGTVTTTLGKMYISTLESICAKSVGCFPSHDEIVSEFKKRLKKTND
jgi:uncharacterized protein (DUF697 family)